MLAVIALLILWAALFTAIEAAQQHLQALRPGTRQGDKAAARLSFPRHSLILCNSLRRAAVVILCTLLAIYAWAENGPGWAADFLRRAAGAGRLPPRTLATRHPQAVLGFGNTLLGVPLKIPTPGLAAQWHQPAVIAPVCTQIRRGQNSDEPLPDHDDDTEPDTDADRTPGLPGIHALDNITVNDILVPRSEVDGINLDEPIEDIIEQLRTSPRTRLPVFHSDINQVQAAQYPAGSTPAA